MNPLFTAEAQRSQRLRRETEVSTISEFSFANIDGGMGNEHEQRTKPGFDHSPR